MPLPVWITLQHTILRNTSNTPCNISDGEVLIIALVVFAFIGLLLACLLINEVKNNDNS